MQNPKILVVGAGAIGGVCAAILKQQGYDITLVCKYEKVAQQVQSQGLWLVQNDQRTPVPMPAVAHPSQLNQIFDWILLATKATDMIQATHDCLHLLGPNSRLISLQNGICEEILAQIVGPERVIGCVVGWGGTLLQPGSVEKTSDGEFILGQLDGQISPTLLAMQQALQHIVPVELSTTIIAHLYSKLIVNACITSLGAISGLYLGELLNHRHVRNLFIAIMQEAILVAQAMKLPVPPYAGKLHYDQFMNNSLLARIRQHLTIWVIGRKYRRLKSSMLQSLERHNPTEIDYLNGYIVQKGIEIGIPTPINQTIVQIIKDIEQGKKKIDLQHLLQIKLN